MPLRPDLKEFPNLSHTAFQHPLDSKALAALRKIPLVPQITRYLSERFAERLFRLENYSCAIQVGTGQYPSLYRQYQKMARVLDVRRLPELFIHTRSEINAYTTGMENYSIVVFSGLIDILNEDELLAVIGHELGHVKCDHMLYTTAANLLKIFGTSILEQTPIIGQLTAFTTQIALLEWFRKAELSADRAALLATQNIEAVCGLLSKLAGYSKNLRDELNIESVKQQADLYGEISADSGFERFLKMRKLMEETHPYPIVRVSEISKWGESEEYVRILRGQYPVLPGPNNQITAWRLPLPTPKGLLCPKCRNGSPMGASFCGVCSTNIRNAQVICGHCHEPVQTDWAVCTYCGNKLDDTMFNPYPGN